MVSPDAFTGVAALKHSLKPMASGDATAAARDTAAAAQGSASSIVGDNLLDAARQLFVKLFDGDSRPVVLYDGVCNMCNGAVDVAVSRDPDGTHFRFAALQSGIGRKLLTLCGRSPDDLSSMIVVQSDGTCLAKSDAALFVGRRLEGSPALSGVSEVASRLLPKAVRDLAYNALAKNRYRVLGRRDELRVGDKDKPTADRFLSDDGAGPIPA